MVASSGKGQPAAPPPSRFENGDASTPSITTNESSLAMATATNCAANPPEPSGQQQLLHFPILSQVWTADELRILEEGLSKFSADNISMLMRYIKIASTLPDKTTRDVALRCKWMQKKENGKRKKTEESILVKKLKEKKGPEPLMRGVLAAASAHPVLPPYPQAVPVESDNSNHADVVGTTGELLEKNAQLLTQIKGNLATHKVQENSELFARLKDNILSILNGMTTMPGIMSQMPPLPVKLNLDLANQILPKPMGPPPLPVHHHVPH